MIRTLITSMLAAFAFSAFAAVDLNQASQAELETVKGIGPGLSGKILEARKTGAFKNWADMVDRVGGVGPGNAAKFSKDGLTVNGGTFEAAPAVAKVAAPKTASAVKPELAEPVSAAKAPRK